MYEKKARAYAKSYKSLFTCDPTDDEIMQWLEEQSQFHTHGSHFYLLRVTHKW